MQITRRQRQASQGRATVSIINYIDTWVVLTAGKSKQSGFPYINALHSYVIFMLFLAKSANMRHANENAGRRDREHAQYLQDAASSSPT